VPLERVEIAECRRSQDRRSEREVGRFEDGIVIVAQDGRATG